MNAAYKRAADRKEKRRIKGIELGLRKKKVHKVQPRRSAFNRLERNCKKFVMLRANFRNSGFCEVGMTCYGRGSAEVWYHIFPQALGNGTKYDHRAILVSCHSCNEGEYVARKANSDIYVNLHKKLLGETLYNELDALKGRKPIDTTTATLMANVYRELIDKEIWKLPDSAVYAVAEQGGLVQ